MHTYLPSLLAQVTISSDTLVGLPVLALGITALIAFVEVRMRVMAHAQDLHRLEAAVKELLLRVDAQNERVGEVETGHRVLTEVLARIEKDVRAGFERLHTDLAALAGKVGA